MVYIILLVERTHDILMSFPLSQEVNISGKKLSDNAKSPMSQLALYMVRRGAARCGAVDDRHLQV